MQKLYRHDFGAAIAIGIEDENPKEIESRYYSFWNHGATSGELHWLTEHFAYFWTTSKNLDYALVYSSLYQLLNIERGQTKKKRNGLMPAAMEIAQARYDAIESLEFLGECTWKANQIEYNLGYIEYYAPDLAFH